MKAASAKRDSGARMTAAPELSTRQLVERALGSDGRASMSAGAIGAMANELHHLTFRLGALGTATASDLEELGEYVAQIAYRAEGVAELERALNGIAAKPRRAGVSAAQATFEVLDKLWDHVRRLKVASPSRPGEDSGPWGRLEMALREERLLALDAAFEGRTGPKGVARRDIKPAR